MVAFTATIPALTTALVSANQVKVAAILSRYGWLPQSKIGTNAAGALFLVVQHAGLDMMQQYLPALLKMSAQSEAQKIHTAMTEDRILMYQGKNKHMTHKHREDLTRMAPQHILSDLQKMQKLCMKEEQQQALVTP